MVSMKLNQLIHELKRRGYDVKEIEGYLKAHGNEFEDKVPDIRTIRKYYNMTEAALNTNCSKPMAFDAFEDVIIEAVKGLPDDYCISSVYDLLVEKYVDPEDPEKLDRLPGNQQTLRNYVRHLKESGRIKREEGGRRYQYVFDAQPGDQALIDFGETVVNGCRKRIHFICVLLRYSRYLYVHAQDHKYNSEEACRAIYWSFCKFGGRPRQLVIDQDAVFVATETYGEVVETTTFRRFLQEQELALWTCRKADPEGKGPIENSVKFVKSSFFSGRTFESPEEVIDRLPGWMKRQNERLHQGIFRVPSVLLREIEQSELLPLIPSEFDESPLAYLSYKTRGKAYIPYKSSRYWVSDEYGFSQLYYRIFNDKIIIYNEDKVPVREHFLSSLKGADVIAEEDRRSTDNNWQLKADKLRARWNVPELDHLINGFKKESKNDTRLLARQLRSIYELLDKYEPSMDFLSPFVSECCKRYRYRFSQFKELFERRWQALDRGDHAMQDASPAMPEACFAVADRGMESYADAFRQRCGEER